MRFQASLGMPVPAHSVAGSWSGGACSVVSFLKSHCDVADAGYGAGRPYLARVLVNQRLTAPGHFQDTRHIELDLGDSGLAYEPGWLLAVRPRQPPASVAAFLARCALDPEEWVRVEAAQQPDGGHGASAEVRGCPRLTYQI